MIGPVIASSPSRAMRGDESSLLVREIVNKLSGIKEANAQMYRNLKDAHGELPVGATTLPEIWATFTELGDVDSAKFALQRASRLHADNLISQVSCTDTNLDRLIALLKGIDFDKANRKKKCNRGERP